MVFMNARKRNKTLIMILVGAISVGLLMSVSMYFMGADYSTGTSGLAPGSVEAKAVQDFQQGMTLIQQNKIEDAQKKFTSAKAGFEEALKTNPQNVQVLGDLATTHYYMGNADNAIETVQKALEINPDFTTARMNYGIYLAYGKNNTADAIKELEKIKKGDFNYDQAQRLIGEISNISPQLPLLPGNNASAPTDQNSSEAGGGVNPFTGLEEGSELPPNHPNID